MDKRFNQLNIVLILTTEEDERAAFWKRLTTEIRAYYHSRSTQVTPEKITSYRYYPKISRQLAGIAHDGFLITLLNQWMLVINVNKSNWEGTAMDLELRLGLLFSQYSVSTIFDQIVRSPRVMGRLISKL